MDNILCRTDQGHEEAGAEPPAGVRLLVVVGGGAAAAPARTAAAADQQACTEDSKVYGSKQNNKHS